MVELLIDSLKGLLIVLPVLAWIFVCGYCIFYAFKKAKDKKWYKYPYKRIFVKALALSHLLAPTLIGGWSWAMILPASLTIYGCIVSYLIGFPNLRIKDIKAFIGFSFVCFIATFILIYGAGYICSVLDKKKVQKDRNI